MEHPTADLVEQDEVVLLARPKGISAEVRDDSLDDQREATNLPLQRLVTAVRTDRAASEVSDEFSEYLGAVAVLADRQARSRFPADPECRARGERNREATLTVDVPRQVRGKVGLTSIGWARVLPRS